MTAKMGMPRTAAIGSLCGAQGEAGRVLPLTSYSVRLKMFRFIKITMNHRFFVQVKQRRASALNSFEAGPTAALPVDAGA